MRSAVPVLMRPGFCPQSETAVTGSAPSLPQCSVCPRAARGHVLGSAASHRPWPGVWGTCTRVHAHLPASPEAQDEEQEHRAHLTPAAGTGPAGVGGAEAALPSQGSRAGNKEPLLLPPVLCEVLGPPGLQRKWTLVIPRQQAPG